MKAEQGPLWGCDPESAPGADNGRWRFDACSEATD